MKKFDISRNSLINSDFSSSTSEDVAENTSVQKSSATPETLIAIIISELIKAGAAK